MNMFFKTTMVALAITTAGATGAMAGKATTPNATTPPVVSTIQFLLNFSQQSSQVDYDALRQALAAEYDISSDRITLFLSSYN